MPTVEKRTFDFSKPYSLINKQCHPFHKKGIKTFSTRGQKSKNRYFSLRKRRASPESTKNPNLSLRKIKKQSKSKCNNFHVIQVVNTKKFSFKIKQVTMRPPEAQHLRATGEKAFRGVHQKLIPTKSDYFYMNNSDLSIPRRLIRSLTSSKKTFSNSSPSKLTHNQLSMKGGFSSSPEKAKPFFQNLSNIKSSIVEENNKIPKSRRTKYSFKFSIGELGSYQNNKTTTSLANLPSLVNTEAQSDCKSPRKNPNRDRGVQKRLKANNCRSLVLNSKFIKSLKTVKTSESIYPKDPPSLSNLGTLYKLNSNTIKTIAKSKIKISRQKKQIRQRKNRKLKYFTNLKDSNLIPILLKNFPKERRSIILEKNQKIVEKGASLASLEPNADGTYEEVFMHQSVNQFKQTNTSPKSPCFIFKTPFQRYKKPGYQRSFMEKSFYNQPQRKKETCQRHTIVFSNPWAVTMKGYLN